MLDKQNGDVLSLKTGYDTSKITPDWDGTKGELDLEIDGSATTAHIKTALELLEFENVLPVSANTRKVWVFPVLPDVESLHYRVDEAAGLVRHYRLDGSNISITRVLSRAEDIARNILFGKQGYLGLPLSDAEKEIYKALVKEQVTIKMFGQSISFVSYKSLHLAISDSVEEGKWLIAAGPRKGQLFWDHTASKYGPGAAGSSWVAQDDFWSTGQPDDAGGADYARFEGGPDNWELVDFGGSTSGYIGHHDLRLWDGSILARLVEIKEATKEAASSPVLEVDFGEVRRTAQRHLILTEDHISVDDPDTRDPLDDTKVDASKIELRMTNIPDDTLYARISMSAPWIAMTKPVVKGVSQDYYAFTLAELWDGQIAIRAGDGLASGSGTKIVFRIQVADGGMPGVPSGRAHLSDSDPNNDDADPVTSEIPIIVTAKATAGIRSLLDADRALTPNDATLSSWKQTATTYRGILHVVAKLLDKRIGDVLSLRSGYDTSKVTFRWDGSKGELSMKFDSGASISEIKTALRLLELDTKVASSASTRKVRIFPTLSVVRGFRHRFDETTGTVHRYVYDTAFQSFLLDGKIFARLVELEESPPNPILRVDSGKFQTTSLRRLVLSEYHIRLDDVDARDPSDDTKVDGSKITFRVRGISGAKLQHLFEGNWRDIPSRNRTQEFTLRQLREGLVSLLPNAAGTLTFEIQAADDGSLLSDSDYYDNENDADPLGVSIRVVALKEIYAGKEMPVSDDRRATDRRRWRSHAQRCNTRCLDRCCNKWTTESACEAGGWEKRRCALRGEWPWGRLD